MSDFSIYMTLSTMFNFLILSSCIFLSFKLINFFKSITNK